MFPQSPPELSQADYEALQLARAEAWREFLDALAGAPLAREAYRRWQLAERAVFEAQRARRESEVREA
jgi:heme oxygenase